MNVIVGCCATALVAIVVIGIVGFGSLAQPAISLQRALISRTLEDSRFYIHAAYPEGAEPGAELQLMLAVDADGRRADRLYPRQPERAGATIVTVPPTGDPYRYKCALVSHFRVAPPDIANDPTKLPPNFGLLPTAREAETAARSSLRQRIYLIPLLLPLFLLGAFLQTLSSICLILRSFDRFDPAREQLDLILIALRDFFVFLSPNLGGVADAVAAAVVFLFEVLDLSKLLETLFVDVQVTCEGTQVRCSK